MSSFFSALSFSTFNKVANSLLDTCSLAIFKEKELHNKTTLIISLIILLGILFIFLYRENFLKRKLKVSEAELKTRNEELMVSREELRKAKDIAEASSRMKTTFIQSMTHEIRTPLNSIVGFSQVLSDHYSNSPETQEFVNSLRSALVRFSASFLAYAVNRYNFP